MSIVAQQLSIADIDTGGSWHPLDAGADLLTAYCAATGWTSDLPAVGCSIIAARLALTRGGRPLPPGGVLLGIEIRSRSLPPSDARFEYRTTTEVTRSRSGHLLVRACVQLRVAAPGRDVAEVAFTIRWPGE